MEVARRSKLRIRRDGPPPTTAHYHARYVTKSIGYVLCMHSLDQTVDRNGRCKHSSFANERGEQHRRTATVRNPTRQWKACGCELFEQHAFCHKFNNFVWWKFWVPKSSLKRRFTQFLKYTLCAQMPECVCCVNSKISSISEIRVVTCNCKISSGHYRIFG